MKKFYTPRERAQIDSLTPIIKRMDYDAADKLGLLLADVETAARKLRSLAEDLREVTWEDEKLQPFYAGLSDEDRTPLDNYLRAMMKKIDEAEFRAGDLGMDADIIERIYKEACYRAEEKPQDDEEEIAEAAAQ